MKTFLTEWMNKEMPSQSDDTLTQPRLDETLPDEIYIPPNCPNDIESLRACIDAQRGRRMVEQIWTA